MGRRVVHLAFLYRADKLTILPTPNTLEYAVAVIKCFGHFFGVGGRGEGIADHLVHKI